MSGYSVRDLSNEDHEIVTFSSAHILSERTRNRFKVIFLTIILFFTRETNGQWPTSKEQNLQLCDWENTIDCKATNDGKGGVYAAVTKQYYIYGDSDYHIEPYLFKVDRYGYISWSEPVLIKGLGNWQAHVNIIPDGEGGVLIGYVDKKYLYRYHGVEPIYDWKYRIQKVDSTGNLLWEDGVLAINDTCDHIYGSIIEDGAGGCYVAVLSHPLYWLDSNDSGTVVIQHISSDGERLWGETGIVIWEGDLASHVWNPFEMVLGQNGDLLIQNNADYPKKHEFQLLRYDKDGNHLWTIPSRFNWYKTSILSTEDNGVVTFGFIKSGGIWNLAMDRFDYNGNIFWDSAKTLIDSVGEDDFGITNALVYNNQSIFFNWWDSNNLYLQKSTFEGETGFSGKGLMPHQYYSFGTGIYKCDEDIVLVDGIMAQKYSIDGEKLWGVDGLWFADYGATGECLVADNVGGFIMIWQEHAEGVWLKQVNKFGVIGEVLSSIHEYDKNGQIKFNIYQNYPNPCNNTTTISYTLSQNAKARFKMYNINGTETARIDREYCQPGTYSFKLNCSNMSSGVYFYRIIVLDKNDKVLGNSEVKKMIFIK